MRCYWTIPTCSGSSGNYFVEWTAFDIRPGWEQDDRRSAAKAVDLPIFVFIKNRRPFLMALSKFLFCGKSLFTMS